MSCPALHSPSLPLSLCVQRGELSPSSSSSSRAEPTAARCHFLHRLHVALPRAPLLHRSSGWAAAQPHGIQRSRPATATASCSDHSDCPALPHPLHALQHRTHRQSSPPHLPSGVCHTGRRRPTLLLLHCSSLNPLSPLLRFLLHQLRASHRALSLSIPLLARAHASIAAVQRLHPFLSRPLRRFRPDATLHFPLRPSRILPRPTAARPAVTPRPVQPHPPQQLHLHPLSHHLLVHLLQSLRPEPRLLLYRLHPGPLPHLHHRLHARHARILHPDHPCPPLHHSLPPATP